MIDHRDKYGDQLVRRFVRPGLLNATNFPTRDPVANDEVRAEGHDQVAAPPPPVPGEVEATARAAPARAKPAAQQGGLLGVDWFGSLQT